MGTVLSYMFARYPSRYTSSWSSKRFCYDTGVPLPTRIHVALEAETIGDKHVAVIGDVHGCLLELQELIGKLNDATNGNCFYVFCGDIVNKGPYSKATLEYVRGLGDNARVVRGNHEDHVIKHYDEWKKEKSCNIATKYDWITSLSDDDVHFLKELPYTISIPSLNVIVVHAGLNPFTSLYHQTPLNMTKMRNISGIGPGETVTVTELGRGYPWAPLWCGPEHVYFGHDAKRGLQLYEHATGLDTGCLYGKFLTAKLLTATGGKEFIQVPSKHVYVVPTFFTRDSEWERAANYRITESDTKLHSVLSHIPILPLAV